MGGDYGCCAYFLAGEFGVLVNVFVDFFEGGQVGAVVVNDGSLVHFDMRDFPVRIGGIILT